MRNKKEGEKGGVKNIYISLIREVSRRDSPSLNIGVVVGCRVAKYTVLCLYKFRLGGRYVGGRYSPTIVYVNMI